MLSSIASAFRGHLDDVQRLVNFDRDVLDLVISSIQELHSRLKVPQVIWMRQRALVEHVERGTWCAGLGATCLQLRSHYSRALSSARDFSSSAISSVWVSSGYSNATLWPWNSSCQVVIVPRLLNYIVAIYLIIIGLLGLFGGSIPHLR